MKKLLMLLLVLSTSAVLFAGCADNKQSSSANVQQSKTKAKISVIGSTSVQPLAQEIADTYDAAQIDYQGVGSSAGIKAVIDGTADIGTSSRELKDEEKASNIKEYIIAYDGIAVVLNPANTVSELTQAQVASIFKGEIKNWKEVGGADEEIIVVSREAGSGTRDAFEEITKLVKDKVSQLSDKALIADGNGAVKQNVASKKNAVGYLSIGYLDTTVKAAKVDGTAATEQNVKEGKYKIMRPFIMMTKGEEKPEVKAFIDYVMGDKGQAVVAKSYISIK